MEPGFLVKVLTRKPKIISHRRIRIHMRFTKGLVIRIPDDITTAVGD
jgi:hypothetical protein